MKMTLVAGCCFALAMLACNGTKPGKNAANPATNPNALLIQMRKSACFGQCPVYTLEVFANGRVDYRGTNHTDKMGLYRRQVPTAELEQLVADFRAAQLPQYDSLYLSGLTDLQLTSLSFFQPDYSQTIKGDFERPPAVLDLEKQLVALADNGEWVQEEAVVPPSAIPNELIIDLATGENAETWARQQDSQYGLRPRKTLVPDQNIWLFECATQPIDPGRLLILIRRSSGVEAAEFNKRLQQRD
ncbi:MAG: DUF6438 domain-containing protein [Bacteroidota bacterium]